jgi:ABC-type oligopeptide transport system ATPase subunit
MSEQPLPVLSVEKLKKHFPIRRGVLRRIVGHVKAVDDVSFSIARGETLSLVGESGCGKTTTSRCILRAVTPTSGVIRFRSYQGKEVDVTSLPRSELRPVRRQMQMIFQDPYSSLNPRMTIADIIGEPLLVNGIGNLEERRKRVAELLDVVQLPRAYLNRFPHAFSGGQRQRIGIARALALNPQLIVADEPVSALDVSVQAQIINLLLELQERLGLSYLFVAHDLSVVKHVSHRVAVMYVGRMVEIAPTAQLFSRRAIPTPRRCSRPCRSPIRASAPSASCSRARSPTPRTCRRAAPSTRAAATPWTAAASKRRNSRPPPTAARSPATAPPNSRCAASRTVRAEPEPTAQSLTPVAEPVRLGGAAP